MKEVQQEGEWGGLKRRTALGWSVYPTFDGVLHAEQSKTSAWDLVSIAVVCTDHG